MAIIPQYKPQTRREAIPAARHQVSADANAFGAGVYGAQGQLAKQIYEIGEEQQKQQDDKNIMDALNKFNKAIQDFSYSDDENNPGFLQTEGYNAQGITKSFESNLYAYMEKEIYPILKTRGQSEKFHQMTTPVFLKTIGTYRQHENKQVSDANINKANSSAELAANTALAFDIKQNAFNPAGVEALKNQISLFAESIFRGQSQETKDAYIQKQLTETYGKPLLEHFVDSTNFNTDALDAMTKHGEKYFDPVFLEKVRQVRDKKLEENEFQADLNFIKTSPEVKDEEGKTDVVKSEAWAYKKYGPKIEVISGADVVGVDESALRFSKGDNPDWSGVTAPTKTGVSRLWSGLTAIDSGVVITSGYRDPERNRRAGGVANSNHLTGNAVDIAFSRNLTTDEQKNVVEQAKALGFKEVLWHDVGSGYHLHVGNYQESGTKTTRTIPADYKKIEAIVNYAKARRKDEEVEEARRERDAEDKLLNDLALLGTDANLTDQLDIVDKAAGLQPHVKANIKANLVSKVKSEDSAIASLDRLVVQKHLTVEDVENMRPYLNHKDYLTYRKQSYEIEAGTYNKEQVSIDNQWHSYLKMTIKDSSKRDQLQNDIKAMLEGSSGQDRLSKAYGIIDKAAKNDKDIFLYSKNNNLERQQLIGIYGDKFVSLVEQGLSKDKFRNTWGGSYGKMSAWMATLGEERKTDLALGAAIDYLLANNYEINPDSVDEAYKTFSGKQSIPRFATTEDVDAKTEPEALESAMVYNDPYYMQRGGTD